MNKQDTRREDVKAQRINEAEERINMNKYYNITELIKDTTKVEAQLSRAEISKVKKWDAFYIYKYSRDVDDAALAIAARTWVELYIAERYEADDWSSFVYILKEVYQRTRTELSEDVCEYLEEMMLEEISSGRTAEARMLIEEYNAEAAKTYKARGEALAAEAEASEEAEADDVEAEYTEAVCEARMLIEEYNAEAAWAQAEADDVEAEYTEAVWADEIEAAATEAAWAQAQAEAKWERSNLTFVNMLANYRDAIATFGREWVKEYPAAACEWSF